MTDPNALPALAPDLIDPGDVQPGEASKTPGDAAYAWHLLAEGDSWFTIAAIPSSNLLYELRLARWTQILNLAYPGDTLRHLSTLAGNADLRRFVARRNFNVRWDALVLSGGGNDLIDSAPRLLRRAPPAGADAADPQSYLDDAAIGPFLAGLQRDFARIAALRDEPESLSRGCPVFLHTYDYPTPRNEPARFLGAVRIAGPWLYRIFDGSGIALPLQQRICDALFDRFAEALLALDGARAGNGVALPGFHVVDTRHTLVMANPVDIGASNDWLNEIHPTLGGYRKIAARLQSRINEVLLAR